MHKSKVGSERVAVGELRRLQPPPPLPYEVASERERERARALVDPARDSLPRPRPVTPLTTYREEVFQCGEFRRLQPPPSSL